jgi:hypothetical protein
MAEPKALSIGEISRAAQASVKEASAELQKLAPGAAIHTVGYFPPRHWLGFVIYKPKIDTATIGQATQLANKVHLAVGEQGRGGKAGIAFDGDLLTIGFAPPPDVGAFKA